MSEQALRNGAGPAARDWWEKLQPSKTSDGEYRRGDRAAAARLRRAPGWLEAAGEPQTIALFNRLGRGHSDQLPRIAVLAAVLSHVREDNTAPVAKAAGPVPGEAEESAVLKPLRLRRLLTAKSDEAILTGFRRLIALMGGKANVADLAWNILTWDRDDTRMKFAFNYWQAGSSAPHSDGPGNNAAA